MGVTKRATPPRVRGPNPNAAWHSKFLEELAKSGNVTHSAKQAGIDRMTAYRHRDDFPEFAGAWDDALEQATDALELEARRRAIEGCERPIVSQGEIIATIREYSDSLMTTLLKAHRPEKYRERQAVDVTSGGEKIEGVKVYLGINPAEEV